MPKQSSKRPPTDINGLARFIVDTATAEPPATPASAAALVPLVSVPVEKNPAAVALGRLGGLKGGKARAASLSKKKRSAIAKKAASVRWRARKRILANG